MPLDVQQIYSNSQLEYDKCSKSVDYIQYIWNELCNEFNISDVSLTILNSNVYPKTAARQLAALGYNVDSSVFKLDNVNGTPLFITSASVVIDSDGITHSLCGGVYGMADQILPCIEYDNESELSLKYRCIEILLRHEIGHIISYHDLFDSRTIEEYNMINDKIDTLTKQKMRLWDTGSTGTLKLLQHYNLPLESLANTAVHITPKTLIDATCLLVEYE